MVCISWIYTTLHWKWKQWAIWAIPLTFCWITLALWRVWLIELKLVSGWWGRSSDKFINFWQGYRFSHCPALWKYIVVHCTGLGGDQKSELEAWSIVDHISHWKASVISLWSKVNIAVYGRIPWRVFITEGVAL